MLDLRSARCRAVRPAGGLLSSRFRTAALSVKIALAGPQDGIVMTHLPVNVRGTNDLELGRTESEARHGPGYSQSLLSGV